jgi:DNA-binding transcriptional MerR regulator
MTKNNVVTGFTRQEVADLCQINPSRLSYLDRAGVLSPQKFGNPKRPICVYSWTQLLELKAIFKLREEVSLQTIRQLVDFLESVGASKTLQDKEIIICGEEIYWHTEENLQKVLIQIKSKIAHRHKFSPGQHAIMELVIIPDLNTLKGEIIEIGQKSDRFKKQGDFMDRVPA